ncbi:hypothetical protein OH77DRAFT_1426606 [Trametes cingulata]|nr:hypothetical protein OH77DRAFT_1426606 [Trametes cingulata]
MASSSSSATLLFTHSPPPPPPTTNTLDARQRARLIRSTRKLGAVLGTTPKLAEHDSPHASPSLLPIGAKHPHARAPSPRKTSAYAKRRQGSVFELPPHTVYDSASSASSSVTSLSLSRTSLESVTSVESTVSLPATKSFSRHVREKSRSKGKQAPLPTPLVLRLNAVPLPPSDPRLLLPVTPDSSGTLTFAQSSASSSSARSPAMLPTTPTTPSTPTVTETRRKRLAKLKRTLGENVPAELVMPFRSTPSSSSSRARQSPPTSESTLSPPPPPQSYTPPPFPQTPRAGATMPRPRPQPGKGKGNRRRSMSVGFQPQQTQSAPAHVVNAGSEDEGEERPSSRVWVTGAGTWRGEWNRRDIREVQQQLRALRAR